MYSGDNIELDALMSDQYDIDHIIPQSLAKDDSWDNRVLVKSELNRRKTNDYPVPDFAVRRERWHIGKFLKRKV